MSNLILQTKYVWKDCGDYEVILEAHTINILELVSKTDPLKPLNFITFPTLPNV